MRSLREVFSQVAIPRIRISSEMFVDVGSAITKVWHQGRLIYSEPTCIAYHATTGAVVAVGQKALKLFGRAPAAVVVAFPVQGGAVAEPELIEGFLKLVFAQIAQESGTYWLFGVRGKYSLHSALSPLERQTWRQTIRRALGMGLQPGVSMDALAGYMMQVKPDHQALCVIDIGAQRIQVGLIGRGTMLHTKTIPWGGMRVTQSIQDTVLKSHQCVLGWLTAENIKREVGSVALVSSEKKSARVTSSVARGLDTQTHLSKSITLQVREFQDVIQAVIDELIEELTLFFAEVPTELVTQLLAEGIYLTGGGSQLTGLDTYLSEKIGCTVWLSETPAEDVVRGLACRL